MVGRDPDRFCYGGVLCLSSNASLIVEQLWLIMNDEYSMDVEVVVVCFYVGL
jgi:hypothetical protein